MTSAVGVAGDGEGGRRRRHQPAGAVQQFDRGRARRCRRRPVTPPLSATSRRSMSTNRPDSGRFDQSGLAVAVTSTIQPSPRFCEVTSGVPSASRAQLRSGQIERRLGQDLPVDLDVGRDRQPLERRLGRKGLEPCRLGPGQGPAQRTVADAQPYWHQRIGRSGPAAAPAKRSRPPPFFTPILDVLAPRCRSGRRCRQVSARRDRVSADPPSRPGVPRCRATARVRDNRGRTAAAGFPPPTGRTRGRRDGGASARPAARWRRRSGVTLHPQAGGVVAQFGRDIQADLASSLWPGSNATVLTGQQTAVGWRQAAPSPVSGFDGSARTILAGERRALAGGRQAQQVRRPFGRIVQHVSGASRCSPSASAAALRSHRPRR